MARAARMVIAGLLLLAGPAVGSAQAVSPVYYQLPAGVNVSTGIATAPNGDVWFAADGTTQPPTTTVGRLRPSLATPETAGGMTTYPTPVPAGANCCANRVTSVAFDGGHDRLWFVQNDGVVGTGGPGQMQPGMSLGMTAMRLAGHQSLADVAVAHEDGAWITENSADNSANYYGNRIAFVSGGLGLQEFDNLAKQSQGGGVDDARYDAKPDGITVDAAGTPWFAEADPGLPGYRIAQGISMGGPRGAGGYAEYLVQPCGTGQPCSGSYTGTGVTDVAVAADGAKWFTNQLKNQVGRLDGTTFTSYDLTAIDAGLAQGQARAITAAPDGSLWVVEYGGYTYASANAIIRIDPTDPHAPTATVYHLGANRFPFGVAPDGAGNVWFTVGTDQAPALIGELPGVLASSGGATNPPPATSDPAGAATPGGNAAPPGSPAPPSGPAPVVLRPATTAPARVDPPQADHASLLADQVCAAYDGAGNCRVVYIISAGEYVDAFPGARVRAAGATAAARKARKGVVLARRVVTTRPGTRKKVRVTLGAKGRRLLKAQHRLRLYFTAELAPAAGRPARILRRVRVTLRR